MGTLIHLDEERQRKPNLDGVQALVAADLSAVNALILRHMESPVGLIPKLAGHVISAGGKRLRPMLTLAATRLCGYAGDRHIGLAATVEFIHTATLLHDDVVDESELRRGNVTANHIFGNKASVLVGDFLFSRAFQLMVADGNLQILDILSSAAAKIAEGEVLQLITSHETETSEQDYLEVIRCKTAVLFAAATQIGAVIAGRPAAEERALHDYGLSLGIAFQLVDDVLDYSANQVALGKTVGDDFREGKITLPVLLAFRRGSSEERQFWRRTLETQELQESDLAHAIQLLERHGALRDSIARAQHYGAMARDALNIFPDSMEKRVLNDVIDFCIHRAY